MVSIVSKIKRLTIVGLGIEKGDFHNNWIEILQIIEKAR